MMMKINLAMGSSLKTASPRGGGQSVVSGALVAIALCAASSCGGGNNPGASPVVTPVTPVVQPTAAPVAAPAPTAANQGLGITGSCPVVPTGTFNQTCGVCFHGNATTVAGQPVCVFKQEVVTAASASGVTGAFAIPVLSPSAPAGPQAWPVYASQTWGFGTLPANAPVFLKQGYHLAFSGTGRWDFTTTSHWASLCRANDLNGMSRLNGRGRHIHEALVNADNNLPEALFGSDGVEAFQLGDEMADRVINHNGVLRIGFNIPTEAMTYACAEFDTLRFTISGCVNSAWTPVPCPQE